VAGHQNSDRGLKRRKIGYPANSTSILQSSRLMKVWITCFFVLFGTAELLQWIQKFSLPLPVFVLGGAFLAIASNYSKLNNLPFHPDYEISELPENPAPAVTSSSAPPMPASARSQPSSTVSFTISKPHKPGD
jgi:hypothetical protein